MLVNDVIHLYNNLALLNNGKVYDLSTDNILKNNSNSGILSNSIPLKTYVLNDSVINTYYNFTLINEELIESQMFIKDNHVYMFNNIDSLNEYNVYNIYNTEEYQIVLNSNGSLSSYKGSIKYPKSFANANISEIAFDESSNDTIIMVRYNSSNVLVFDYVTGKEIFNFGDEMEVGLFDYMSSSLSNNTYSLGTLSSKYKQSKNFMDLLNESTNNNVNDLVNMYVSSSNESSNLLRSEYISVYNSNTDSFDIYNINDIIKNNDDIVETYVDDKNNIVVSEKEKKDNKVIDKIEPLSDKVKSNFVLYDYFYNNSSNSSVKENKNIIYIAIISLVVINLLILSYVYGRKEKVYEK